MSLIRPFCVQALELTYEFGSHEGLGVRPGQKEGGVSPSPLLVGSQHTSAVGETEEWVPALKKLRDREPRDRNEM